jgi:DNA-directed RNA polymerase specialized sigma24 family protein
MGKKSAVDKKKTVVYVKSNEQVYDFANNPDYNRVIASGFKSAKLPACDYEIVKNKILDDYAQGKFDKFAPAKGTFDGYLYRSAYNAARAELRHSHYVREQDDNAWWERLPSKRNFFDKIYAEDNKLIVKEAMARLVREMRDPKKLEMLVRYILNDKERAKLAKEYGVKEDFVSLQKTRYLPRLQKLVQKILKEDEKGVLKNADAASLDFLKTYLKNW